MQPAFNPYREWLGLSLDYGAPNYYELLNLATTENDPKKIALAAEQAATKVRAVRPGRHAAEWARLLDEIQQARLTLLDPQRRMQYGQTMSRSGSRSASGSAGRDDVQPQPASVNRSDLYPPGFRPAGSDNRNQETSSAAAISAGTTEHAVAQGPASQATTAGMRVNPAPLAATSAAHPAPASPGVAPGYSLPVAQPLGYSAAVSDPRPLAGVPLGMPMPVPTAALGMTPQPYAAPMPAIPMSAGGPIDPMAPVPIPGVNLPPMAGMMPTGLPMSAMPVGQNGASAIPMSSAPVSMMGGPMAAMAVPVADNYGVPQEVATPQVRKASAASVMMAVRKERQTRSAALLAGGVAGLVVVAGLAAYAVIKSRLGKQDGTSVVASGNPQTKMGVNTGGNFEFKNGSAVKGDANQSVVAPPVPDPMPQVDPLPAPMPAPAPLPTPTSEPAPPVTPAPAPVPGPMPVVKPTRQQVVALEAALKKARLAISEQTFDEAEAEIATAEKLALLPDHKQKVERLKLAIEHVKIFRQSLAEAVSKLEAAETIKVGSSTIVAIVETFPDKLTAQVNGSKRSYLLADMPPGLAAAILDVKRVGGQPDNRLLKAMFVATRKGADDEAVAQAREWLSEAQGSDDNAEELLIFLDDTYELVKEFDAAEKESSAAKTADAAS